MSEQDTSQEKGGIGVVGGTAAGVGGLGLGTLVYKGVVDHSAKRNWGDAYAAQVKTVTESLNAAELFRPDMQRAELVDAVRDAYYESIRMPAHQAFMASSESISTAARTPGTLLSNARATTRQYFNTEAGGAFHDSLSAPFFQQVESKIDTFMAAPDKNAAASELLKYVAAEAEKTDRAFVAHKVRSIPFVSRLNPMNLSELHLTNTQKGLAIGGALATVALGALGIGMVAQWMGQKSQVEK